MAAQNEIIVQRSNQSADIPSIVGLNVVMLAVAGWLGVWAFKHIASLWEKNFDRVEKRIEELEDNQTNFSDVYVRRDDFVRAMVSVDNKLDAIAKRQDEQFHMILDRLGKE